MFAVLMLFWNLLSGIPILKITNPMFAEAQVITIILYLTFIKETYPFSEVLQRHTHTLSSLSALSYLRLSLSLLHLETILTWNSLISIYVQQNCNNYTGVILIIPFILLFFCIKHNLLSRNDPNNPFCILYIIVVEIVISNL